MPTPSWGSLMTISIISFQAQGVQQGLVTALAAGVTTLDVDGMYLGNSVHGSAVVTVTSTPAGFDVDIQWTNPPNTGPAVPKR